MQTVVKELWSSGKCALRVTSMECPFVYSLLLVHAEKYMGKN